MRKVLKPHPGVLNILILGLFGSARKLTPFLIRNRFKKELNLHLVRYVSIATLCIMKRDRMPYYSKGKRAKA